MKTFTNIAACATLLLAASAHAANPFLPLWEHIPDGEPYVFDDPDNPGKQRVYLYGSHDMLKTMYCGTDLVVWSAPVDSLDRWRYDGVIFRVENDGTGRRLKNEADRPDVLYAPDVAERTLPDGSKEYFLYPNNQGGGRNGMVAKSKRPDGPFEVINWNPKNPVETVGPLGFDPAVLIDDDGRVYAYWGFGRSHAAELDPATMATVKPGTEIVYDMVSPLDSVGVGHFFEASSIRKIDDKYVFIYSRRAPDGDFGLPQSNYTLAYAYSDRPLGPYTYGGTIIDARGRDVDEFGYSIPTATPNGNTHGSICKIGDRWWVFFHRQTGIDEYARQAMVAPIEVKVTPGLGGKVEISEAEYTSEGFETDGLDPFRKYPAAIASHFTGPSLAYQTYPVMHYSGPYFQPTYVEDHAMADPYNPAINCNPVVNCTAGSILGYKYFNFDRLKDAGKVSLQLELIPTEYDGTIEVYLEAPWKGHPKPVGHFRLKGTADRHPRTLTSPLTLPKDISGKHPLYLTFTSPQPSQSICTLLHLQFQPQPQAR